jgi:hypothetical protein
MSSEIIRIVASDIVMVFNTSSSYLHKNSFMQYFKFLFNDETDTKLTYTSIVSSLKITKKNIQIIKFSNFIFSTHLQTSLFNTLCITNDMSMFYKRIFPPLL